MKLQDVDFQQAADKLGVDVVSVKAVTRVESRGSGFLPSGEPIILFERHVMDRLLKQKGIVVTNQPDIVNVKSGGYKGGVYEHGRLQKATQIDRDAALQSCSWGLFQVMGYHWRVLKYPSLQAFINAQYKSEAAQLDTFVRFILASPSILKALKSKDWTRFALLYNGRDYAKNDYDNKLRKAYKEIECQKQN